MTAPVAVPVAGFAAHLPVPFTIGHTVHIGPHDVLRHDPEGPLPIAAADADVYVYAVIPHGGPHGGIAVLMWRWHEGTSSGGATVYDYDDQLRCVA